MIDNKTVIDEDAFIDLELDRNKRLVLTIHIPIRMPNPPIIRNNDHCILRPFNKFLTDGNPDTGKITCLLLAKNDNPQARLIATFVITKRRDGNGILKNKRLIIFPRWESSSLSEWRTEPGMVFNFNLHHITLESDNRGRVSYHLTSDNRNAKQKIPKIPLSSDSDQNIMVGQLIIRRYNDLDLAGVLRTKTGWLCQDEAKRLEFLDKLKQYFPEKHPLILLPEDVEWNESRCFIVNISLSPKKPDLNQDNFNLQGLDPALFEGGMAQRDRIYFQSVSSEIDSGLWITISYYLADGIPKGNVVWVSYKSRNVTNQEKEQKKMNG